MYRSIILTLPSQASVSSSFNNQRNAFSCGESSINSPEMLVTISMISSLLPAIEVQLRDGIDDGSCDKVGCTEGIIVGNIDG